MSPSQLPVIQPGQAAGAPPIFEKVAIVGLGLIGASIGLAARRTWPRGLVIGVDCNAVLEKAMVLHAVDVGADDPVILSEADLVILAGPVLQNVEMLPRLAGYLAGPALVTDTGSTKRAILSASRNLPASLTFIGGHPLAGEAQDGIDHASPDLFQQRPWILTPAPDVEGGRLSALEAFVRGLGAEPAVLDAAVHDRVLAYLSHLPQLAATALMAVIGDAVGADGLALAGRGLADATRLAASPPPIWRDVCASNADNLVPALDALLAVLGELRGNLTEGEQVASLGERARRWREALKG